MLLNCDRNRNNGPRFFPSGKRLAPYFCRRFSASAVSRPLRGSVVRRFANSATEIACQATSSALSAFAPMLLLRSIVDKRYHRTRNFADAVRFARRLLTPVATPVSPHGDGTGPSKFSDYTKCGLVVAMRWLFVAT